MNRWITHLETGTGTLVDQSGAVLPPSMAMPILFVHGLCFSQPDERPLSLSSLSRQSSCSQPKGWKKKA